MEIGIKSIKGKYRCNFVAEGRQGLVEELWELKKSHQRGWHMEYKTIEELYLAVGVAGAIIVVFLGVFVYTIVQNDKRRSQEMKEITDTLKQLILDNQLLNTAIDKLSEATKEVATTNRIVADTVSKVDYYNRELHKKLDKHDEKSDKILDELRR